MVVLILYACTCRWVQVDRLVYVSELDKLGGISNRLCYIYNM